MVKYLAKGYLWALLLLLYSPILIIMIFSFTEAKVLGNWTGFSTKLYSSLFAGNVQHSLVSALWNTFAIAMIAATVSTLLGSVAAIGIFNLKARARNAVSFVNNIPMLNPDIITGISLFLLFVSLGISQGLTTVVLAHITFCTPYVVLSVMPRLKKMNQNVYEAALDLGATPFQALRKVILPLTLPGLGATLGFVFTAAWSEVLFALMLIKSTERMTFPVGLLNFVSKFSVDWGQMMAAGVLALIPSCLFFIFIQRYLVQGLTSGAVKG